MPKGKKFDAAEKHFIEKEKVYQRRILELNNTVKQSAVIKREMFEKIQNLQSENDQLKEWIDRLLSYTELSESDIKKACEKDKRMAEMFGMFGMVSKVLGDTY